jgi:tetratricopeptide (TPR) repeat protein
MTIHRVRFGFRLLWLPAVLWGFACGGAQAPAVTPADIPALEAAAKQRPSDSRAALQLARAYYAASRWADAQRAARQAIAADPRNVEAQAYLGLTYEELAQFDSARAVYTRLLSGRPSSDVQKLLRGRLTLLTRRELQYAARQAIARESLLTRTPPDPNTVAVMPFRYVGRDSSLRPLERGLAALVVTDLSRVRRLRLVERERLQVLLDEMKISESGRADPATSARSGRLVGAGQMVQGQFQEVPTQQIRIDATVVRATDAQVAASGSGADRLQSLFDIEKSIVFQLLDRMAITLTPAERQQISERPTRDLQAFLLYSRGLEAQDRGDFGAASQAFQAAARQDPSFQQASQRAGATQDAAAATAAPVTEVASTIGGTGGTGGGAPDAGTLGGAIGSVAPTGADKIASVPATGGGPVTTGTQTTADLPPPAPNKLCEATLSCGPPNAGLRGTLIIIVRRP